MDRYDMIVVGAGSAGAVLAERLSINLERRVLLVEAGAEHTAAATPAAVASLNYFNAMQNPQHLWPDLTARRTADRPAAPYRRGRGVGGSSSVNGLAAIRGTDADYDRWVSEYGCPGWGWSDLRPAFLRVEDDIEFGGDDRHGRGGPIPLTRLAFENMAPIDRAMRAATGALGYPTCDDCHSPDATGVSRWALTVRDGHRVSTNDAYLEPARHRPNLTIWGDTLVEQVILDGTTAVAVRTSRGDVEAGEIILSAGAIHSPAILLRSGIGTDDGLPVGHNLKDHATCWFNLALHPAARKQSNDGPVIHSMLRYTSGLADAGPNDMQIIWFNSMNADHAGLARGAVAGAVMRVFSHGRVRLRSSDPLDDPDVEVCLLSDESDLIRLRDATHRIIDILTQAAITDIATVTASDRPIEHLDSDHAIDAWLADTVTDYVHAAGTCRMGTPPDPAAVVDTTCNVIGYQHLRVCDASVMPDLPRANTHLTTVAIAEHLATKLTA